MIYMSKKAVMISLDEFIHTHAKSRGLNISKVCEKALREAVDGSITDPKEERECFLCSRTNVNMIWLCPDEKWICNKCLNAKARKCMVAIASR